MIHSGYEAYKYVIMKADCFSIQNFFKIWFFYVYLHVQNQEIILNYYFNTFCVKNSLGY